MGGRGTTNISGLLSARLLARTARRCVRVVTDSERHCIGVAPSTEQESLICPKNKPTTDLTCAVSPCGSIRRSEAGEFVWSEKFGQPCWCDNHCQHLKVEQPHWMQEASERVVRSAPVSLAIRHLSKFMLR